MQFKVIGSGRYEAVQSFTQSPEVLAWFPVEHTFYNRARQLGFASQDNGSF